MARHFLPPTLLDRPCENRVCGSICTASKQGIARTFLVSDHKFSSTSDVNKLLEGYRYRIVSLEIELRQLVKANQITNTEFKKRRQKIKKLRELVAANPNIQAPVSSRYEIKDKVEATAAIPLSMEEHQVYVQHLRENSIRLYAIKKEALKIRYWLRKITCGGAFSLLAPLNISFLRKAFMKIEAWAHQFSVEGENLRKNAAIVTKTVQKILDCSIDESSTVKSLQQIFIKIDDLDKNIMKKNFILQRNARENQYKSEWLQQQEQRFEFQRKESRFSQEHHFITTEK